MLVYGGINFTSVVIITKKWKSNVTVVTSFLTRGIKIIYNLGEQVEIVLSYGAENQCAL